MDMGSLAATRLTANAEALAAFYETRKYCGARAPAANSSGPSGDTTRSRAGRRKRSTSRGSTARCGASRRAATTRPLMMLATTAETGKVLADDEVRFEPHPHPQKRYDPIDMQPRLELLFEEALVPHRDRDLFLSEWKRGRVDEQALSDHIKGLVMRRAHLREIGGAARGARKAAARSGPGRRNRPALVEAEPSTHVAGVLDPSRSRFFPARRRCRAARR